MVSHSVESWVLLALIYKDLDDMDYSNALLLAERLYAIDNTNRDYRWVYGKCLYSLQDYNGAYDILKDTMSIACLHLFARSCLALGDLSDQTDKKTKFWRQGIQAVLQALKLYKKDAPSNMYQWGNDLASVSVRHHIPSQASLTHLVSELYIKLDNIRAAAAHLWSCLRDNPFKLAAYIKLCEIAPDVMNADAVSPDDIFNDFTITDTSLRRCVSLDGLPALPSFHSPHGITIKPGSKPTSFTTASTATQTKPGKTAIAPVTKSASGDPVIFTPSSTTATASSMTSENIPANLQSYMPSLRSNYADVTLHELQALVKVSVDAESELDEVSVERGQLELEKDEHIEMINRDIEEHRNAEAYKNKHGLHRKPPAETVPDMTVDLMDANDVPSPSLATPSFFHHGPPPRVILPEGVPASTRLVQRQASDENESPSSIKERLRPSKKRAGSITLLSTNPKRRTSSTTAPQHQRQSSTDEKRTLQTMTSVEMASQRQAKALIAYFVPMASLDDPVAASPPTASLDSSAQTPAAAAMQSTPGDRSPLTTTHNTTEQTPTTHNTPDDPEQVILAAMNRIIHVIRALAFGYMYQSSYKCRSTALALQQLDDRQYDTARVLCLLGHAYYDAGDYQIARVFYRRGFAIAPWYCDDIPIYSTCLWYLDKEQELNLLAYKMKANHSRRYEAYIAAGNWTKCAKRGNEAIKWFQKAVDLHPTRSYGHALLGYEEWEKGNHLGAKQHFAKCMMVNKRFYLGWYGAALAYVGMHEFQQAQTLLQEALRLHPRHPVLLCTMAEVLYCLKQYPSALEYVISSLATQDTPAAQELKHRIELEAQQPVVTPTASPD